ncbi:hypothetical protein T484DRAFT_1827226 [Baffinella frigidus]|nr:hypothetical protein T484DRAFT_1827226 [Cryptophyta sp. CCMP2293]
MFEKEYDPWKAYGGSKLANILFANELQRRLGAQDCRGILLANELQRRLEAQVVGLFLI